MSLFDLVREYPTTSIALAMLTPYISEYVANGIARLTRKCLANRILLKQILLIDNNADDESRQKIMKKLIFDGPEEPYQLNLIPYEPHLKPLTEAENAAINQIYEPIQLDMFPQKIEKETESREINEEKTYRFPSSILHHIEPDKNRTDIGVVLVSHFDVSLKTNRLLNTIRLRRALMKQYRIKRLKMLVVIGATRDDLMAAIGNPNIHHITVDGHGSWSSWQDENGDSINNKECIPHGAEVHTKKTFVRNTCGNPTKWENYEDQLGSHYAEDVFGRSRIANMPSFLLEPLAKTTPDQFIADKNRSNKEALKDKNFIKLLARNLGQIKNIFLNGIKRLLRKIKK